MGQGSAQHVVLEARAPGQGGSHDPEEEVHAIGQGNVHDPVMEVHAMGQGSVVDPALHAAHDPRGGCPRDGTAHSWRLYAVGPRQRSGRRT